MKNDNYSLSDWENDISEENQEIDNSYSIIQDLNNLTIKLDNRKRENNQKLSLLRTIPNDEKRKITFPSTDSGSLIDNHNVFIHGLHGIQRIDTGNLRNISGVNGTSSAYSIVNSFSANLHVQPVWYNDFQLEFGKIADDEQRKNLLEKRIYLLNPSLKVIFIKANNEFINAKNQIIEAYLASSSIRNFIQKFWGELANLAREKSEIKKRLELKKEKHRQLVAQRIAQDRYNEYLNNRLAELHKIHDELSKKVKDSMFNDYKTLERSFYNLRILVEDILSHIMNLK